MKNLAQLIHAGMASEEILKGVPLDELKAIKSESVPNYRFFIDDTPAVERTVIYRDSYATEEEFAEVKKLVEAKRLVLNDTISTEQVDRMSDIIMQSGLDTKAYKRNPQVLWAHDSRALPVGRGRSVRKGKMSDGTKATFADTEFYTEDLNPHAEVVRQMVFAKALPGRSIGFVPLKMRFPDEAERKELGMFSFWGAVFEKSELIEYSVVPVPANAGAEQEKALANAKSLYAELKSAGAIEMDVVDEVFNSTPITEQNAIELSKARQRSFVDFGGLGDRLREALGAKEVPAPTPAPAPAAEPEDTNALIIKRLDAIDERLASLQHGTPAAPDGAPAPDSTSLTEEKDTPYAVLLEADGDKLAAMFKSNMKTDTE